LSGTGANQIVAEPEPSRLLSRELSWLAFNERVLDEAADARWPLLERLKFVAIFHRNLDEFFMIRVAGLQGQQGDERGPDGLTPREQLREIGSTVRRQLAMASALLSDDLLPALAKAGVHLRDWTSLGTAARLEAQAYFRSTVFPVLTPLAVDPGHPFPFISNLSVSLAVEAEDPETGQRRFARVKVPEILPRFVPLGEHEFLPLEELIAAHLDALFPGMKVLGAYAFRITRDMDFEILEAEADDLLQSVYREVRRRKFGDVIKLEVDPRTPPRIREFLLGKLQMGTEELYEAHAPLGAAALFALASLPRPELHDAPHSPSILTAFTEGDPFAAIRAGEVLLHHPYDSFAPVR
jgi:polyphosphate kinase